MTRLIFILSTILCIIVGKSQAAELPTVSETPLPWVKMMAFAAACDDAQLSRLFARVPTLKVSQGDSVISPLNIVQTKFLAAITAGDANYTRKCKASISVIMSNSTYRTVDDIGRQTDFMYYLAGMKDFTAAQIAAADLNTMFALMKGAPDYDINRQTQSAPNDVTPRTAAGVLAAYGSAKLWCKVKTLEPAITMTLDSQPYPTTYTPVLLASAYGNLEMVKMLIGEGADWKISLKQFPDWPILDIANATAHKDLAAWIIQHSQGGSGAQEMTCADIKFD